MTLLLLLPVLTACGPLELTGETLDSASAEAPPCALAEGSWSVSVGGDDALCTGGLETANGADVTVECTDPTEHVANASWEADGVGYAVTCTGTEGAVRCAFGGIDLDATVSDGGTRFSGSWAGLQCADVWSGALGE